MKINIHDVKKEVGSVKSFQFIVSADTLGFKDPPTWLDDQLTVDGQVINNGQTLDVDGLIHGQAKFSCSRCLDEFSMQLAIPFNEEFSEEECAQDSEDANVTSFQGDEIDLTDIVRDSVILAEPLKPVCSENCQGLCPKCGVNRNKQACECTLNEVDPRLEKLRLLLDKNW